MNYENGNGNARNQQCKELESCGLASNVLVKYSKPFKDEMQNALFKDPVRTTQ